MIKQIEENLGLTNKNKSIIHNFLFTHKTTRRRSEAEDANLFRF